ncbi:protein TESPA1 isoform X3 [Perognathus longimembris pacificus]|uniref:protein TESPA1 isoform X3 n=1 Tax=Perognathus longimembris pacificus TaxID=214514 RepID=UPI002019F3EB|nr:protein TESPA1 isoform X3 [Perognathus longimembris pacificus]
MEASVLSPTSWEKRRAWLLQSRNWQTQVLEEEAAAALQDVPGPGPSSLDDVFREGTPINKIEDWLQDCGDTEDLAEDTGESTDNGCYSHGISFEDDLTLGAEATLLDANGKLFSRNFLQTARPGQLLNLGCSLASSSMTSGTNKTNSSISEILDQVEEDAEDVLFSLGFGQEDHKDTCRISARFFINPSQAKGINFQLFLKSQVQRIEMEDPCLMLAKEQQGTLAIPQILHCKTEPSCWAQSLNKTEPPCSPNPAQLEKELCGLQESHSDKNKTFWKRKSQTRKCLFPKSPLDRKVEPLDLSNIQQRWKQIPNRPEMYQHVTQQSQDTFDTEEGQRNNEEEENCCPGKPRQPCFDQNYLGKDSQSLLNGHHNIYPKKNGFPEVPTSHLWQEVVHSFPSSSYSLALQTPECTRRPTAWYIKKKTRPRELDSAS